jgi:hypothetical protein
MTADSERPVDEPGPISPPGPSSSPAAQIQDGTDPLDLQSLIEERSKSLHSQNSVINMRSREVVKVLKRKIKEVDKLAADKCAP